MFNASIRRCGFTKLRLDPCMYIICKGKDFTIITVGVDDLLLFSTTQELMDWTKADLHAEWEVKDMGEPSKIVSIEVNRTDDSITISQRKYIESILKGEDMDHSNSVAMPLDPNVTLTKNPDGSEGNRSNSFARLLGEVQFIANTTRPDITHTISRLAPYIANPSIQHITALK